MTYQLLTLGIKLGITTSLISWLIGMIVNDILIKTEYYKKVAYLNFIESKALNKIIGINQFKWIVNNTFFRHLNQQIKLEKRSPNLIQLRSEMTKAEVSHLIGFIFVAIIAIYISIERGFLAGFTMMFPNVILNLYPTLLQQENKRRIDEILKVKNKNCS
ncbi:glycosyl-4,4'-diaponeurosporenoate acyltransferase CrtO family protein [Robertkochia sediminum]|uniref:glycosyl-4,4'-diaponeurosporenoate acyltransferase CrtO family protein n=1 Tax=Robertkochia sediminum TaxID=2785326 RepID=UPI0019319477|nr:hypothetical protein [Robertkochia sediminum]MBL7471189.1 hypothetical protein [Robertkochia sediminum]